MNSSTLPVPHALLKGFMADLFVEAMVPELFDDELSPYQVLIRRLDEDAIWAALEHVPYHIRKLKPGVGRTGDPTLDECVQIVAPDAQ